MYSGVRTGTSGGASSQSWANNLSMTTLIRWLFIEEDHFHLLTPPTTLAHNAITGRNLS